MNRHKHKRSFDTGKKRQSPQEAGAFTRCDYNNVHLRDLRFDSPDSSELFMDLRYYNKAFAGSTETAVKLPPTSESTSSTAGSGGMVYKAFPHGLWYGDQFSLMGGLGLLGGLAMAGAFYGAVGPDGLFLSPVRMNVLVSILLTLAFLVLTPLAVLFVLNDVVGYRFSKSVLFDRNAQKVHLLTFKPSLSNWSRCDLRTFDWHCVTAEVDAMRVFTGTVGRSEIGLRCLVMDRPGGAQVIDQFSLGVNMPAHHVQPLLDTWEHVRRFMQHEGPLFSDQDDGPNPGLGKQPFWRYLWMFPDLMLGGIKDFFVSARRDKSVVALMFAVGGAVVTAMALPLLLIFGLFPWISSLTKREPKWPAEILASVGGNPLSGNDLAAWRSVIPGPGRISPAPQPQALHR